MNAVGDTEITGVRAIEHKITFVRLINPHAGHPGANDPRGRAACTNEYVFHREPGSGDPPNVVVGTKRRVVVDGEDMGEHLICCTGRDPRDGGYVSVKWEV